MRAVKTGKQTHGREAAIVLLGAITWGFTMMMRTSFGYFTDVLSLSTAQTGVANAVLSASVCISAIILGWLAGKSGRYAIYISAVLFVCAVAVLLLSGAGSYGFLLLSRVILGIGCGPLFALIMKNVELVSDNREYARNVGIVSNGEAFVSTILGPVIIVFLLNTIGFRFTNLLFAGILVVLGLIWLHYRERPKAGDNIKETPHPRMESRQAENNYVGRGEKSEKKEGKYGARVILCLIGGSLDMTAGWCIYMYVPSLLQKMGGLPDVTMSFVMTLMGVFMAVWMFLFPAVYGKIKKKQLAVLGSVLAAIGMAGMGLAPAWRISIILFILFGGLASVMGLFFMAIFSVEGVNQRKTAAVMAFVNGGCELLGASIGPMIAGWIADWAGLQISMMISALCMIASAIMVVMVAGLDKRK